jgi:hypothetical protein
MSQPTPRADALRAMREAKFDFNQRRMREDMGRTSDRPKAIAKKAAKKKVAKSSRSRG